MNSLEKKNEVSFSEFYFQDDKLDFDSIERNLESELNLQLAELTFLEKEKDQIGNPDALGETIKNIVWEKFINQIAITAGEDFIKENNGLTLDLRSEAHIQTAENFTGGKIAKHNYISRENLEQNYDRYSNTSHKDFRKKYVNPNMDTTLERAGKLKSKNIDEVIDIYTGRKIPTESKLPNGKNNPKAAQREHVKSSAELYQNPSLQMANDNEGLAKIINSRENLQGYTTAERNQRKSDKSVDKIDSQDKTKHWETANEKAEKYIKQEEKKGEERLRREGKQTQKEEAFRIGGKALRVVVMQLFSELIKEIIKKLVKWFKNSKRNLESLIEHIKIAVISFIKNLKEHVVNLGDTLFTTISTAIFGPVVGVIKKIWIMLKQGWNSLKEAIDFLKNSKNKNMPMSIKILEVGKILIVGLSGIGAIALGETIEKGLKIIPVFNIEIPLLGSLSNIIGIFMGAVVAGIIGAIGINLIEKFVEKKLKKDNIEKQIEKGNEILKIQKELCLINIDKYMDTKEEKANLIRDRHLQADKIMKKALDDIFNYEYEDHSADFDEIDFMIENLPDIK